MYHLRDELVTSPEFSPSLSNVSLDYLHTRFVCELIPSITVRTISSLSVFQNKQLNFS